MRTQIDQSAGEPVTHFKEKENEMAYGRSTRSRRAPSRAGARRSTVRRSTRATTRRTTTRRRAAPRRAAAPRTIRIVVETQNSNGVQRPDLGLKSPPKPRQPAFN